MLRRCFLRHSKLRSPYAERAYCLAVSTLLGGPYGLTDVYLSTPCIVGSCEVERVIELVLSNQEKQDLHASHDVLREAFQGVDRKSSI